MSSKAPKSLGRCIFCGRPGLSKEHIWSDWIGELIPPNPNHGEYWASIHKDHGNSEIEWTEPAQSRTRQGSALQRKVRNVCERNCNNGWMSRVVDRAKPIVRKLIKGEPLVLERQSQINVAAWIGITTIVQEFANRRGARSIPAEDRYELMKHEVPPSSWTIWLARYEGIWWSPMGHYHIPITYSKPSVQVEHGLQLLTFTLGALLVHVFTSTQSEMIDDYRAYIGGAENSQKLFQLWPITADKVSWSQQPFSDEDVDQLAFNWIASEWKVNDLPGRPQEIKLLQLVEQLKKAMQRDYDED